MYEIIKGGCSQTHSETLSLVTQIRTFARKASTPKQKQIKQILFSFPSDQNLSLYQPCSRSGFNIGLRSSAQRGEREIKCDKSKPIGEAKSRNKTRQSLLLWIGEGDVKIHWLGEREGVGSLDKACGPSVHQHCVLICAVCPWGCWD